MADKIDKGFALSYWKLSYRRKFIRTLWLSPVWLVLVWLITRNIDRDLMYLLLVVMFLSSLFQLIYTYVKWQKEARGQKNLHDYFD